MTFRQSAPRAYAIAVLLTLAPTAAFGQGHRDEDSFGPERIRGAIELDGRLDEPAWARLDSLPMVAYQPVAGDPPSERTVIRAGYDDRHLYVGAELHESDPDDITVNTFTRDRVANDDLIEILIDTYNDNETGVILSVNPAGTRLDAQVSNDAEFTNGSPINYSWDAFWDAETNRTDFGWTAEIRIPFSSLRFQTRDDRVVMGLILTRVIARTNEIVTFPEIDPSKSFGFNKPSQARDVVLRDVEPSRPVYVSPYAIMEAARRNGEAAPGQDNPAETTEELEFGGDLRYALTDNLNLDVTANPDFAQAEADDQQVNLDRFSLFFPEKRRFFQERAGIFDFRTGQNNRLFHSRRIGIVDGRRIPIFGGMRVVGRIGGWDVGMLDMQTAESDGLPGENFAVARLRRRVFNEFSHLGGMLTSRIGAATNLAYGLDGTFRLGDDTYASLDWAQSFEEGEGSLATSTARALVENRSREGVGYRLSLGRAGSGYNPGIGFTQRLDYRQVAAEFRYGLLPGDDSWIQRVGPRVELLYLTRDTDGGLETAELTVGGQLQTDVGLTVSGGVSTTRERLIEGFALGNGTAAVPAGQYDFLWGRTFVSTPPSRPLHATLFLRAGRFFDGTATRVTFSPRWRISPNLLWGMDVQRNDVRFPSRNQTFTADVLRLRANLSLQTDLSAIAFVQYNSSDALVSSKLRVRYNFGEGEDLWFVYDEARNTMDQLDDKFLPETRSRTVILKYVHTFEF